MMDLERYALLFVVVMGVSYVAGKYKTQSQKTEEEEEYELIRTYLLNESPLYGYNKPKLWIHTKYEVNARKWRSFYSRNTTDLNQPYLHLTVKTIINHCGEDFNICLIDDHSFRKLIPLWTIDVAALPDPLKSLARQLGMAQLISLYGGMAVPNSFLCTKNLLELYQKGISQDVPFLCENASRSTLQKAGSDKRFLFTPSPEFMGAKRNDSVMRDFVLYLKNKMQFYHIHQEDEILGESAHWWLKAVDKQRAILLGGELVGVKTDKRYPILLDDLMEEGFLAIHPDHYGIWIPEDEILRRSKYQWFAVLSADDILNSNLILAKYFKASMVEGGDITN